MHQLLYLAAASVAAPATTAVPPSPVAATAPAAQAAAADPERLRLARQTVDFVWPLGTYKKMMGDMMGPEGMLGAVFDMKLGDVVAPGKEMSAEDKKIAETTMRDAIAAKDPHFQERMRITMEVMGAEMGAVMTKVEPAVRDGLAKAFARKFTTTQLQDLNVFFATPTGRFYAAESMSLFMDPELLKSMMAMMPELMKAMPAIQEKVKKATAHLPEPPKDDEDEADEEAEEEPSA